MDVISYSMAKKYSNMVALGLASATVDDVNKSITFTLAADGSQHTIHFSQPSDGHDGISVTGISDKGNGKFTLLLSDGSETDPIQCVKGSDGFSPTAKVEKVGDTATITITDKDGTTTATIKDGQGGSGGSGEENTIDSISVNGVNVAPDENKNVDITVPSIDGLAKTEDIPTKVSELTNDSGYLTEHQDISGKVDKVDGKSLIADTEIERLASVDNYDDTQVKTAIQAVANGLMDSVGYSADYKTIDIITKNGVKKSVNVAPIISHASITELSDVDTTNKATGKALVYNATTSKHEYADVSGTDEKVKMNASTDAKYLGELLDNITIANENGELKVKKLDGQEVTITEINYLKGLTMNVMDLVNMFSNGGVKIINTPVATYAELLTIDKSSFIEGISYLVYVLADENHDNAKTTYLVDKDSETPTYFGFADSQRDFTTNPIDLATEITGKLGIANMDSDAIKALFTVDDTYKTETATNNAFSTHGAKALYDELLLAIGNKANSSDLTAHKDDTDIHVSTEDRTKWNSAKTHADSAHAPSNAQENVLETVKVNGTALEVSNKAVNVTVPTTVAELTDSSSYAKTTDIPTSLPADGGNADTVNNHTVKSDVPENAVFTDTIYDDTEVKGSIEELSSNLNTLEFGEVAGGKNLFNGNFFEKVLDNGINYTDVDLSKEQNTIKDIKGIVFAVFGAYLKKGTYTFSYTNDAYFSLNRIAIAGTNCTRIIESIRKSYTWTQNTDGWTYFGIEGDDSETGVTDTPFSITPNIQIEKGTQATEYEPYIPSVKMIAEEVDKQNESLEVLGKCKNLLNPTLQTTTKDGVTCTNNGDGTYTVSGTATKNFTFSFINRADTLDMCQQFKGKFFKFISNINDIEQLGHSYMCIGQSLSEDWNKWGSQINNGKIAKIDTQIYGIVCDLHIFSGDTFDNVLIKPMLTTNLSANYDDFVPYTGDGETLASDVAEIKNDLDKIKQSVIGDDWVKSWTYKVSSTTPEMFALHWSNSTVIFCVFYNKVIPFNQPFTGETYTATVSENILTVTTSAAGILRTI